LVTSAIIQVDQLVDEDWPLEVIGRDGVARNLTCHPGDMILYESHSTIHGRPFALNGDYYANLFVHFEPVGHSMRHAQQSMPSSETAQASYERAWSHHQQQQDQHDDEDDSNDKDAAPSPTLPYYVPIDKEARWRQQFEYEKDAKVCDFFV
jgi:prolyl 4-hydroxylase